MKTKATLSAVLGFFFGLITYFLLRQISPNDALCLSVLAGLFFFVLLFVFLLIYGKIMDKRYAEIERAITSPVFYKANGNFNLGGAVKNGNIYFCDTGIVCVCLEEKPYTLDEILLQDIVQYQFDDIHFTIFTTDGRIFVITTPDASQIVEVLRKKKWIQIQHIR